MKRRTAALANRLKRYTRSKSIQFMITISFTLVAVGGMVLIGILLYAQFTQNLEQTIVQENSQLVHQIYLNVNAYTSSMQGISDSMYYNVIKKADLSEQTLGREMNLLYEANTDMLISIACFTEDGELVAASPNSTRKPGVDVREQEWFLRANSAIENNHFSTPHVQNLFEDTSGRYRWVVSLSRMVQLSSGGDTSRGVLLVDMNYSGIEQIFSQKPTPDGSYVYLIDKGGEIIYHPRQKLIFANLFSENNLAAAGYADGVHQELFNGEWRQVIVKTVSYTGWKVVSVIPNRVFAVSFSQMRLLVIAIVGFAILLIIVLNSFVSARVADPIKKLEQSVKDLETGSVDLDIYMGGPYEIEHLGRTIRSAVDQMRVLMDDVVHEQEMKRTAEFDALQAQINPHFLYNTLDSIVWMIESDRYSEAISMVTALANLFRISLARGSNAIPIKTELQHAGYYLHIQNIRYKNKFRVTTEVDPDILDCSIIKLSIQPLLENAIYHAMEMMDGDGEIAIRGYRQNGDVYLEVRDNGLGMTPEKVAGLLAGEGGGAPGKRGSGIGLKNVHQRIRLYYGDGYGLEVESELDVGTTIRIHLPEEREPGAAAEGVGA